MLDQNTFRFHKFTEEEKKPDRYGNTYSKGFFSSNLLSTRQKSRPFQNRQSSSQDYTSKNFNSKSYQFKNSNNIPSLTSRNFNKNNFFYSDNNLSSSSNFPLGKIINTDFGLILKKGDTTIIDKFLPQMIYNDLSFSNNNHLQLILKKFQDVLEFLFTEQNKLLNNNNQIEELYNNQNSNLNKKLRQLEQDEYRTNNLLNANHAQISRLVKKIKTYKRILISTGNEKLIPNITLMKMESKGGYYHCEICPEIFKTYEEIHTHYIMEHFKSFDNKNMIYNSNNLNKKYFENQLNMFKTQLKNELLYINKEYDDVANNKKYSDLKQDINLSDVNRSNKFINSQTHRNKIHSSNNLRDFRDISSFPNNGINSQLKILESEQKQQFQKMTEYFNKLKLDIFNEIKNLGINQSNENNIKIEILNTNQENDNNVNSQNDKNQNNDTNNNDNNIHTNNINNNKYINNSKIIPENKEESKYSFNTPGLNNSSFKAPSINPYLSENNNIEDKNNNKNSQFGENINDNNNDKNNNNDINKNNSNNNSDINNSNNNTNNNNDINNNNNDNYDKNDNNYKIIQKSQIEEKISYNNNNYFKKSIMQNSIENEIRDSFNNKIKRLDPKITNLLSEYNSYKNKDNSKEIEEIIKEREQKYCKNKKDYKEIINNIMKDNKKKSELGPKFMEYYNKAIENYNIPELKTIALEYQQKEEELKNNEEEEEKESKKEKLFESKPVIDYDEFLEEEIKKASKRKSIVKKDKDKDTYNSIDNLLEKDKNLKEDI